MTTLDDWIDRFLAFAAAERGFSPHTVAANCVRLVGKGGRERVVPLGRIARQRLSEYQADARPTLVAGARARPELFVSRRGTPLSRQMVWKLLKRYVRVASLDPRFSPH